MKIPLLGTFNYRDREGVILGFLIMLVLSVVPFVGGAMYVFIRQLRDFVPFKDKDKLAAENYLKHFGWDVDYIKEVNNDEIRFVSDGENAVVAHSKNMFEKYREAI